jgi:hypothetical protein
MLRVNTILPGQRYGTDSTTLICSQIYTNINLSLSQQYFSATLFALSVSLFLLLSDPFPVSATLKYQILGHPRNLPSTRMSHFLPCSCSFVEFLFSNSVLSRPSGPFISSCNACRGDSARC